MAADHRPSWRQKQRPLHPRRGSSWMSRSPTSRAPPAPVSPRQTWRRGEGHHRRHRRRVDVWRAEEELAGHCACCTSAAALRVRRLAVWRSDLRRSRTPSTAPETSSSSSRKAVLLSPQTKRRRGGGKRRTNGERNEEELAESGPCFARIQRRAPATHSHARSLNRPRGRARASKVRLQCMHDDCSRRSALYAFFPAPLSRLLETSLPEAP